MKEHLSLSLPTPFAVKVVHLFPWCFSQPENQSPQPPPSPRPLSIPDDLTEAVQRLLPPNSTPFNDIELKVLGDTPIGVGGCADIWGATLDNRDVTLKSYRLYETGDTKCPSRVRCMSPLARNDLNSGPEILQRNLCVQSALPFECCPVCWGCLYAESPPLSRPRHWRPPRHQRAPRKELES